jgi:hypothetical protein
LCGRTPLYLDRRLRPGRLSIHELVQTPQLLLPPTRFFPASQIYSKCISPPSLFPHWFLIRVCNSYRSFSSFPGKYQYIRAVEPVALDVGHRLLTESCLHAARALWGVSHPNRGTAQATGKKHKSHGVFRTSYFCGLLFGSYLHTLCQKRTGKRMASLSFS